ncbi:MAG: TIGR02646 family protein [Bacteroidales bacterium]|jgi:uncharacterized protein (TIGR02646 family)|nr:TIGR02646 family protein [Bacteroidales bacterium]
MKQIIKDREPRSLTEYRLKQDSTFNNLPPKVKQELRESLLKEQGYICSYCMKRIPENEGMKIEHYQCQSQRPELQLTYSNLLGVCMGNEGKPNNMQTCDTKKADTTLSINPLNQNCELLFKYSAMGEISSIGGDVEINRQLNDVLNLNMQTLKENRKRVYMEVQKKIKKKSNGKSKQSRQRDFEKERDGWLNKTNGKFKQFCMVAVYVLNKEIKK